MKESLAARFRRAGGLLPNLRDGALPEVGRNNAGRWWPGVAMLALLLAAGCTGATPTPEANTPEATELPPPTAVVVAATWQPTPTATTLIPAAATDVSPTALPPTPTVSPPAADAVMVLPSIADIVEQVRPAVVSIVAEVVGRDFRGVFSQFGSGTGVIIDSQGLVLTNNHVIEGASAITVTMDDDSHVEAEVVGADRLSDLAVLRIPEGDYTVLPVNPEIQPRPGEWVIAIGNALALPGGPTVTVGVVSAVGRTIEAGQGVTLYDLIQTDTVINPGNSGGPLIGLEGQLVGINTSVLRGSGGGTAIEGIGFAINMETAAQVSQQLIDVGRVQWAYLGLDLADLIPTERAAAMGLAVREGVAVARVVIDGPSDRAGIEPGDIILSLDGEKLTALEDLIRMLRQELIVGQEVVVEVFRDGSKKTLQLVLGERPVR